MLVFSATEGRQKLLLFIFPKASPSMLLPAEQTLQTPSPEQEPSRDWVWVLRLAIRTSSLLGVIPISDVYTWGGRAFSWGLLLHRPVQPPQHYKVNPQPGRLTTSPGSPRVTCPRWFPLSQRRELAYIIATTPPARCTVLIN